MHELIEEWKWARQLSVSLLKILPEAILCGSPIKSAGPWWKQFRHLARVQENYADALETRSIVFSTANSRYSGGTDKRKLIEYLEDVDRKFINTINNSEASLQIDWYGKPTSLHLHLCRLLTHETLHHGQFILYSREIGLQLPSNWEAWGEGKSD